LLYSRPNPQRFKRRRKRLRLQHHSLAAAKRPVVHGAMAIVRKRPQIVDAHLDQPLGQRSAHDAVLENAGEESRKDSDDVEAHPAPVPEVLAFPDLKGET
jgi:hypothetical protein